MSTVETIEYYTNCPSCGATNDGTGVCDYCGASLVKSKKVTGYTETLEDALMREDAGIPVVKVKSGEVSKFLVLFCSLFGGLFIAVPTILFAAFAASGILQVWLVLFFALFWAIGIGSFVPLIASMNARRKCLSGQRVIGTVRRYENGNVTINGSPVKVIYIRVDEGGSRIIELNTMDNKCRYSIGSQVALKMGGGCCLIEGTA